MNARAIVLLVSTAGMLLAPAFAQAQRGHPDYGLLAQAQGPTRKGEQPRGGREGRPPQRDERQQGRLSDEDRRGLHQDLDRANREIYKPAPRR